MSGSEPRLYNRDLLPLPYLDAATPPSVSLSRSVRQRVLRERAVVVECNRTIVVANTLAGHSQPPALSASRAQRAAQQQFVDVHAAAPRVQWTREATKEAECALLGRSIAYDSD